MSHKHHRVIVIILSFNQKNRTLQCLESLRNEELYKIVLWDNNSDDDTVEAVSQRFPEVFVHKHPTNLGVASGRNAAADLAIREFSPSHLLFLDNDMIVEQGFVKSLLKPFHDDPTGKIGQVQAKLRFMSDPKRLNDGGGCIVQFWSGKTMPVGYGEIDEGQYDQVTKCISCGGAMMVRREIFQELGGFDSSFDPFGPEDLDFSLRLQKAGYQALYVPQAVAYHEVSHSFSPGEYSEIYAEHKSRHWIKFLLRHGSLFDKFCFFSISAPIHLLRVIFREARKGNVKAIKGVVKGVLKRN